MDRRILILLAAVAVVVVGPWLVRTSNRPGARTTVSTPPSAPVEQTRGRGALPDDPAGTASRTSVDPLVEPTTHPEVVPTFSSTIHGRFIDSAGVGIAGVEVKLVEPPLRARAESDAAGRFELSLPHRDDGSSARSCTLRARCDGFTPARREVALHAESIVWLPDWVLRGGAPVTGTVRDSLGLGVAEAMVGCLREDVPGTVLSSVADLDPEALLLEEPRAKTAADGTFALEGVPYGERRFVVAAEGWETTLSHSFELRAGASVDDVDIRLAARAGPASIAGVVLSPAGEGVARARLRMRSSSGTRTLLADDAGRFVAARVPPHPHEIVATDPEGRWGEARIADVQAGTKDLKIHLTAASTFMLIVEGEDGDRVDPYEVTLQSQDGATLLRRAVEHPAATGTELARPATTFQIHVQAAGWMPFASESLSPVGLPERWVARLSPASGLSGIVLADGAPHGGAVVSVHAAFDHLALVNGSAVRSDPLPAFSARTEDDGGYLIGVPVSGDYYVRVEADGWASAEHGPIRLAPNATERLDFRLGHGGALEVALRAQSGGVAGYIVRVARGDGFPQTKRTDESGVVRFDGLMPGPWHVAVVPEEEDPRGFVVRSTERALEELEANSRVVEGIVERITLWLEGQSEGAWGLSGVLRIDGGDGGGWLARLQGDSGFRSREVPVGQDGAFELLVGAPGTYRLTLTRSSEQDKVPCVLIDTVSIDDAESPWSCSFATASMQGVVPVPYRAGGGQLFHRWSRGTVECWTPLFPDPEGHVTAEALPAGAGSIVRAAVDRPLSEEAVETLLEVHLRPRSMTEFDWPP